MLRSLGFAEIVLIALLLLLLFGGRWIGRTGKAAGRSVRSPWLLAKWTWAVSTGTDEEGRRAEREFGKARAREVLDMYETASDPSKRELTERLSQQLCRTLPEETFPVTCAILASSERNAFALPGGFIFFHEGLFDEFRHDRDALAFVLAHEMQHVLLGHAREQLIRRFFLRAVTARSGGAGQLLKMVIDQGYSREDELEADRSAVALLAESGFAPSGAVRVLRAFASSGVPGWEYLSSHPPAEERIRALQEAGAFSATSSTDQPGSAAG